MGPCRRRTIAELPDWAHDQQGRYQPSFTLCDREADMAQAYNTFVQRLGLDVPAD